MASSLMASQTLTLSNPNYLSSSAHPRQQRFTLSKSFTLSLSRPIPQTPDFTLRKSRVLASSSSSASTITPISPSSIPTPVVPLLAGSTRTITTIFAIAQLVSRFVAHKIVGELAGIHGLREGLMLACISARGRASVNTPITVVAAGMAKWLDIYSGVLLVRVLLSWFPTIPWEKQPLSAIRDLCDPYLNLFRGIIPPIMNTLDISPLFAFSVLGALASLMRQSKAV